MSEPKSLVELNAEKRLWLDFLGEAECVIESQRIGEKLKELTLQIEIVETKGE